MQSPCSSFEAYGYFGNLLFKDEDQHGVKELSSIARAVLEVGDRRNSWLGVFFGEGVEDQATSLWACVVDTTDPTLVTVGDPTHCVLGVSFEDGVVEAIASILHQEAMVVWLSVAVLFVCFLNITDRGAVLSCLS